MNEVVGTLQHSAALVKAWGESRLPNGKTLAEMLTFQGLSLWEVVAADLALYQVPQALPLDARPPGWALKPRLSWGKHAALDLLTIQHNPQGCAQWPPAPVFLFLGFSPYMYRDALQPVVTRLMEESVVHSVTLYDGRRFGAAPVGEGKGFQSIWQHWDNEVAGEARELGRAFKKALAELQAMRALPAVIKDQGRPLWPLLKAKFDQQFRVNLPRLLPQLAVARHILRRHRPSLIISPDVADPRTRIYGLMGLQYDIPTLEIQFGLCGPEGVEWQFFNAKQVAVWGEMSREALLAHGVPAERITLTGFPSHDTMANVPQAEVARTRARLGIPEGQAMVLFASTYSISTYDEMTSPAFLAAIKKTIFQAAQRVSGLTLVVKPHPLEDVRQLRQLVQGCHNVLLVKKDTDIRELIKASDAFASLGSSITLEAIITRQLTICPIFPGWVWTDPFGESGAVLVPRSAEEVVSCFQMVVNGSRDRVLAELEPARRRFLEQWVYKIDGQASARIAALAVEMTQQGHTGVHNREAGLMEKEASEAYLTGDSA